MIPAFIKKHEYKTALFFAIFSVKNASKLEESNTIFNAVDVASFFVSSTKKESISFSLIIFSSLFFASRFSLKNLIDITAREILTREKRKSGSFL